MQEVSWKTGNYSIKIISKNPYSYFHGLRSGEKDTFLIDIVHLSLGLMSISRFKGIHNISTIEELVYSPCSHHVFTIQDDRFVEHSGEVDVG